MPINGHPNAALLGAIRRAGDTGPVTAGTQHAAAVAVPELGAAAKDVGSDRPAHPLADLAYYVEHLSTTSGS